jgi:hypothetical protein
VHERRSKQTGSILLRHAWKTLRWLKRYGKAGSAQAHLGKFQAGFPVYQHALAQATQDRLNTLQPTHQQDALFRGTTSMYETFVPLVLELMGETKR